MRARIAILAALTAVPLLLGYWATSSANPPADFVFGNRGDVVTLDPAQMTWLQDTRVGWSLWEGLLAYDPKDVTPIAGVAAFPPDLSADGKTYTFHLRPDARWSNGDPVTAHDFAFAWRRAIEPGTAGDYVLLYLDHIAGAREYFDWRSDAVAKLTAMRALARGRTIEYDAAIRLEPILPDDLRAAVFDELPTPPAKAASDEEQRRFADAWRRRAARLVKQGPQFWQSLADDYRAAHLDQMESHAARIGWRALDDHTFQVTLVRPTAYFPELAAYVTFLPVHRSIERLRSITPEGLWIYDPQWPKPDYHANGYPGLVSNGPFRLREWEFKRYLLIEKNPYYWDADNVALDTVRIISYESMNTLFLAYEQGQIDVLTEIPDEFCPELIAAARAGTRDDVYRFDAFGTYFYNFNCRPTLPGGAENVFLDRRVRHAFNIAIDRQAIVDNVLKQDNPVARTLVPPGVPGYPRPHGLPYDPDRARALMADAGYPGGAGFPEVELAMNTGGGHEPIAQTVAKMWQDVLGVRVRIRAQEVKTFNDLRRRGDFMIARFSWYGDYMDPTTFLDLFQSENGNNDSGWHNAEYDALLARAAETLDRDRRMAILADAERLLVERELPLIPLFTYVNVYLIRPNVHGVYPNRRLMNPLKYVSIAGP